MIADATTVATRARSGVTSPLPSGWTRFDRNTTNALRHGIDPERRPGETGVAERADAAAARRGLTNTSSRCPSRARARSDRRSRSPASSFSRPSAARECASPCSCRRRAACWQKIARSAAVLNNPAWPATPPIRRAVGSWTTPRIISCPVRRTASRTRCSGSVGAIRGRSGSRRQERRVLHAERLEDVLPRELVEPAGRSRAGRCRRAGSS